MGRNRNPPAAGRHLFLTYPLYHLPLHSNLDHPISSLNSYWSKAMSQEVTRAESIEEQERAREDSDKKPKSRRPASMFFLINPFDHD